MKPPSPAVPELLAPAGSMDALHAAVQNGADAVYLGMGAFHARGRSGGFSEEDFREALRYCRLWGVRVYLTLNTLLTDRELPLAVEQARSACRLGVDAVLVQDWGLFAMLRRILPDLPLHASTQMSIFTSGGARLLHRAGCTRIVAARECSMEDIASLCAHGGAEIEAFVHGALCMCYSGQCEMSCLLGGRSGNRGLCAQPCRMPCGGGRAALSLKDLSLADHIPELIASGVKCLKIEGRMRRAEYVAVVTGIYARLLRDRRGPTAEEAQDLEAAFSRSGFTDGYWTGRTGNAMFGQRPEGLPEPKALFDRARKTYGTTAARTAGAEPVRFVPVTLSCAIQAGIPCSLTASDDRGHTVRATGPIPEAARNRPLTAAEVSERLARTGGTCFRCEAAAVDVGENLSLPAKAVNALRRDALDALSRLRMAPPIRRELSMDSSAPEADPCRYPPGNPEVPDPDPLPPRLTVSVRKAGQIPAVLECSPARIAAPLSVLDGADDLPAFGGEWCAILPRVWRDRDEAALLRTLDRIRRRGVCGVLAGNLGHIGLLRGYGAASGADLASGSDPASGFHIYGDFGLNVYNSQSLGWLASLGVLSACVSFELRMAQIRDLKRTIPTEAIVYGRLPLMITENRPLPTPGPAGCLTDRRGERFPLLSVSGGRTEIENSRPVWLADWDGWKTCGLRYARLRFTVETGEECAAVCRAYCGAADPAPPASFTRGRYR